MGCTFIRSETQYLAFFAKPLIVEQDVIVEDVIDDEIHKQVDLLDATRLDMTRNEPEVVAQSTYNHYQYQMPSTGESYR